MRLLVSILVLSASVTSAWASQSKGVESLQLIPGAQGERTLVLRSSKLHIQAHGRPALLWAECEIHTTSGAWGFLGEVGIRHHGSYTLDPRFKLDLPSDLLSAMAAPKGWRYQLSLGWYQGSLSKNRSPERFLLSFQQAAEVVAKTSDARAIGPVQLDILLNACGVPGGMNPQLVDTSELVY